MPKLLLDPQGRPVVANGRLRVGEAGEPCCCDQPPGSGTCCLDLDRYDCETRGVVCCHLGRRFRVRLLGQVRYEFIQDQEALGWDTRSDYRCPPPIGVAGRREYCVSTINAQAVLSCEEDESGRPRWTVSGLAGSIITHWERFRFDDYLVARGIWRTGNGQLVTMFDETYSPDADWWLSRTGNGQPFMDPHWGLTQARAFWGRGGAEWPVAFQQSVPSWVTDREQRLGCAGDLEVPYVNPEPGNAIPGWPCGNVQPRPVAAYHWQGHASCAFTNFTETIEQEAYSCGTNPEASAYFNWRYGSARFHNNVEVLVDQIDGCWAPCTSTELRACELTDGTCDNLTLSACVARGGFWRRDVVCSGAAGGSGSRGGGGVTYVPATGCMGCDSSPRPRTPAEMEAWLRGGL